MVQFLEKALENYNFLILIDLQPVVVNFSYFKLLLIDQAELKSLKN